MGCASLRCIALHCASLRCIARWVGEFVRNPFRWAFDMSSTGILFGVGLGPGDAELITRKAARILAEVDWIFLPTGKKSGTSFAGRIVEPLGLAKAKFRPVSLCMARSRQEDMKAYEHVAEEILSELQRGKSAAWIAEGDPLFYSTFGHILEAIRRRCPSVPVEIVPGVTSLQAAAGRAVMPVACLDDKVAILPAAYCLERLPSLLNEFATIFLIKVHSVFDQLLNLLAGIPDVQAIYVENVGTAEERLVTDLETLRGRELSYFSLVILRMSGRKPDVNLSHVGLTPRSSPSETIHVVGLGPGQRNLLTAQAQEALARSEAIVGYSGYFEGILDLIQGKEWHRFPLGQERQRADLAVELARSGKTVAVISSGDPGVYAMASILLEAVQENSEVSKTLEVCVVPGISAVNAAAALLGAPLGHDFAVISLSDMLTPWEIIERRLQAAAQADFVLALLNPKSKERGWQLGRACEIILGHRAPDTPTGIVRNAYRPGQDVRIASLAELRAAEVDMFTTVIVGNSRTRRFGKHLITPREMILAEPNTPARRLGQPVGKMNPDNILDESFRIIEREVGAQSFAAEEWPVVRRMIHACGDLDLVHAVEFRHDAVRAGIEAIRNKTPLITDVTMVAAGINKAALQELNLEVHCFINDADVLAQAGGKQTTRSYEAMYKALARFPEAIVVIGNAPTALSAVCEAIHHNKARPKLLLAMPVGFVGVLESKAQAMKLDIPVIAVHGRRGGSSVAAAAVNALLECQRSKVKGQRSFDF